MFIRNLILSASAFTLAACATVGEDFTTPATPAFAPESFSITSNLTPLNAEPAHDWWTRAGDPLLNTLVEKALEENRDIRAALASVNAARAQARLTDTLDRPIGEVTADYVYSDLPGTEEFNIAAQSQFAVGAGAAWELDFVGRLQRLEDAALADLEEAVWLSRDARVLTISETADAYIQLRTAETGLDIA
ncbi:MAG: TolC family protein [Pseudomonadota bacterium]